MAQDSIDQLTGQNLGLGWWLQLVLFAAPCFSRFQHCMTDLLFLPAFPPASVWLPVPSSWHLWLDRLHLVSFSVLLLQFERSNCVLGMLLIILRCQNSDGINVWHMVKLFSFIKGVPLGRDTDCTAKWGMQGTAYGPLYVERLGGEN